MGTCLFGVDTASPLPLPRLPPSVEKVYTAARLITVASRVAALMTFSFLRGSDSSPSDRRLRLSRPALKLRRRRRLRWFHYRSLTSQRACYSYFFIYFCRLSLSPGLRHGEAKGAERRRIDWRRTECEKPLAAHLSLHPPPLASPPPLPTRGTNWGVGQRICCGRTVDGVWAWLARGTVAGKPRNWSERPEDAGLDRFTSGKTQQDPARIPPGSRLLGLPLRPQTRP